MSLISEEETIRSIVRSSVESFSEGFRSRHEGEADDPDGTINSKIHNVFIAVLGDELRYYTALVRSFDSSLGNMLEKMAINIAKLFYIVKRNVSGPLSIEQTQRIAELLEKYKRREKCPSVGDYQGLRDKLKDSTIGERRHESDYYLIDKENNLHSLIELKIGGDLDNKKARSEKEAILEQFAILSNTLPESKNIRIYFATAYNKFGEGNDWIQGRVRQYFADKELLIGKDFWNFICKSDHGYEIVLDEYKNSSRFIKSALESIKRRYLG
ncbi:MAG: TdeIII family type II restriction endonuclease [Atribacterota bacterium]